MKATERGEKTMNEKYDAPILNDTETLVLQAVCRHHMLGLPFNPKRATRYCNAPVWIINHHLKSLIKRKVLKRCGDHYIPLMQASGAPVVMPEIYFENGVKIIRCPRMYAEGYARMRNL
ncbi:MAG: hypothetical protein DI626_01410 [Micavibrio aeruginosavorus]|uniref:Uncharacterized protein n=1 Tax=Micavibrio aeruginosavorus TaxID=349221 RepID=A0A2W5A5J7_9BACT|nr:MAG: hypothetical protein DI626_01410 [Micavibrio aeruginosavorus]